MSPNPKKKKIEIISFDDIVNATVLSVSAATIATTFENDINSTRKVINRTRKGSMSFSEIWDRKFWKKKKK